MVFRTGRAARRPHIGVTGNARRWSPSWIAIRCAIYLAGGRALRIHVGCRLDPAQLDAILVSGGDDIHPTLYGKDEMPRAHYDPARDALEEEYIRFALDKQLPLMGICRGHQLINVIMGGTLHTDIRQRRKNTSNTGTILPRKTVNVSQGSLLSGLVRRPRLKVNSLHHQAVDQVASKMRIVGVDLDEFVQALEHEAGAPVLSVQWHPEYLFYLPAQLGLFRWLVVQAGREAKGT